MLQPVFTIDAGARVGDRSAARRPGRGGSAGDRGLASVACPRSAAHRRPGAGERGRALDHRGRAEARAGPASASSRAIPWIGQAWSEPPRGRRGPERDDDRCPAVAGRRSRRSADRRLDRERAEPQRDDRHRLPLRPPECCGAAGAAAGDAVPGRWPLAVGRAAGGGRGYVRRGRGCARSNPILSPHRPCSRSCRCR